MKNFLNFIWMLFFIVGLSCNKSDSQRADQQFLYLQQNSVQTQNGIALAADRSVLYVSLPTDARDYRDRPRVQIFARKWQDSVFAAPEPVDFASNWSDYHPVLSPDGQRMFFNSTRPIPGETDENR